MDLEYRKDYDGAVKCYDKAINVDPTYEYAWVKKGDALTGLQKYYEAIECYKRFITINPHRTWEHCPLTVWRPLCLNCSCWVRYDDDTIRRQNIIIRH